ncbi:DUF4307 domain-containing protein [Amycolatopsis magusensis]|uniref:DUF4307 domain-containing protein n=1 Tax=Amycolatopsis magusensis TaxID=882444 RepID=A0ABS4PH82_9PSEU|nr:DUF4307 domain-containing protein [Amycolatopsis magusensis]MBP2178767.1 hypothetical protein [Amycolatopsis magusensis]MDI5982356.1 DUF4307 domain-containing protein [Amycolatopsis magusensis]
MPTETPARLPEGRYGKPKRPAPKRWRTWALSAAGLLVGGAVAVLAYANLGTAPIEGERRLFTELPGDAMEITVDVTRDEPERAGVCIVRVRDITGAESGRREVLVPPGESSTAVKAVIKSRGRPVTADVFGCSYEVPEYLSTP